jgi:hypothetical protein
MNENTQQSPLQDILLELMVQNEFSEKIHITSTKTLAAVMDTFRASTESAQEGNGLLKKVLTKETDLGKIKPILQDTLLETMVANETLQKIYDRLTETSDALPQGPGQSPASAPASVGTAETPAAERSAAAAPFQTTGSETAGPSPFVPFSSTAAEGSEQEAADATKYAEAFVDAVNESMGGEKQEAPKNAIEQTLEELITHSAAVSFKMSLLIDDVAAILNLLTFQYEQDEQKQKTGSLQQQERDAELLKILKDLKGGGGDEDEDKPKKPEEGWLSKIIGGLLILGGIVAGFVAGIVKSFDDVFGGIIGKIGKLLKIGPLFEKMGLGKFISGLTEKFGNVFGKVGGFFSKILAPFEDILSLLKTKFTKFFGIGRILGKIAGPAALIFEAVMSIFSAVNKFKETGDIGAALEEGFTSFVKNIVGAPLDLLKSVVSWIVGKLGFGEAEKFLDSFSFTDIIQEFMERLFDLGRQGFQMMFQTLVDVWDDISSEFSGGNVLAGIGEVLRGLVKTLLALPADLVKNGIAGLGEMLGADMSSWRKFSFRKLLGGTDTKVEADSAPPQKDIISASKEITAGKKLAEEQKAVDEHIAKQDRILKKEEDKAKDGMKDDGGIFGLFNNFQKSLVEAYQKNSAGVELASNIGPAAPTAVSGAELVAMQSDTANLNANAEAAKATQQAASNSSKSANVSANAVTYNNNNVPDRTSWMLTPVGAMFR